MMTKINWFKEVLELEPGSKVFFPLARLYFDDGAHGEALATLRHGLERNPDHLEARFMLVEILMRLGREEEAADEVRTITGMLSRYPSFFRVWAKNAALASKDSAMALTFLAASFQGSPISWSQVIERGLDAFFGGNGEDKAPAPKKKKPAPAKKAAETDPNIRTRTMADLLADQGDFEGALTIYEELADGADGREADELMALIEKMRLKLKKGAPAPEPAQPEADEADGGAPDEDLAELVDDVGLAPVPGLDVDVDLDDADDGLDFEPSGGAQPMDVPDIEDTDGFDAQALLDDLLSGDGDGELGEDGGDFEAGPDADDELEFEDDALADLEDMQAEPEGEDDLEAPAEDEAPAPGLPGQDRLLETLEALAERLEARAAT